VPVTERVPFFPVRWFRRIPGLKRWSGGFARGRELPVYEAAIGGFGVVICYESAFEDLPRRYRRAGADFLVNITNDAWFGRTSAPAQHASHLVLRAIETRMGVARAANSGISQFVDPLGRTYASTALETDALIADRLRTSDVTTPYVRLGDWVGTLAVLGTLGLAWLALMPRRPSGAWRTCALGGAVMDGAAVVDVGGTFTDLVAPPRRRHHGAQGAEYAG
jgi:apolipoprotein N-acyltransferase